MLVQIATAGSRLEKDRAMKTSRYLIAVSLLVILRAAGPSRAADSAGVTADPYLWLEERQSPRALDWVKAHDTTTFRELSADSDFSHFREQVLAILNAKDKIPTGEIMGNYVYNFWQDADHVRGLYRRTSLEDYAQPSPKWETVLDIDSLNAAEGRSWVYQSMTVLPPDYRHALVSLSDGGKDASVVREFDLVTKTFVADGFSLPEAKSSVAWYDANTLLVGTDFGPNSLTTSGYPRICKLWKRGTPLSEARTVFEGEVSDVSASGWVDFRADGKVFDLSRGLSFWESAHWIVDSQWQLTEVPFPKDASVEHFFRGYIVAQLFSDWLGYPEGTVLALKIADLKAADLKSKLEVLFQPDEKSTVTGIVSTRDYLLISILRNVRGRVLCLHLDDASGPARWTTTELDLPDYGSVDIVSANDFTNVFMLTFQDFLTPTKLYLYTDASAAPREIKSLPPRFNADGLAISQGQATSADGTAIPYFLVSRKDLTLDGQNPTLLYGYGGFRSSETPFYSGGIGKLWLERGGVYVLANIRGGGEFGPRWHKAALLANRQKAFDDFIAIAEDLIARKITSPPHLGIMGGSNGGLLVGAVFTQRPDLFNAVVCQVPLLDMLRYTLLPAGASWIGEYGDPDSADQRAYIAAYSPYQNVKPGVKYPSILFVTSTADDRVHPAHARKMTARLEELGNKVYFYEETEGGHAASADNIHRAKRVAMEYTYLWKMLAR
jgi:prolyl oligopeptidase